MTRFAIASRRALLAIAAWPALTILAVESCGGAGAPAGGSTGTGGGGGDIFFSDAGPPEPMSDGCADAGGGSGADGSTGCESIEGGVGFGADVAPIFLNNCNGELCHVVPTYSSLVGVHTSECCDRRFLVAPGNAAGSYLLDKLTGQDLCYGGIMPLDKPMLPSAEVLTIQRWICEGAPDN